MNNTFVIVFVNKKHRYSLFVRVTSQPIN